MTLRRDAKRLRDSEIHARMGADEKVSALAVEYGLSRQYLHQIHAEIERRLVAEKQRQSKFTIFKPRYREVEPLQVWTPQAQYLEFVLGADD